MDIITKRFLKSNIIRISYRNVASSKTTDYSEGYSTNSEKEFKKPKKGFQRPPPMYGFKREVVDSDFQPAKLEKKLKKNNFDCEDEKWFSEQLSSSETWRDNIVHENGHGKNMFHPKYGNSFWDPHNYN